MATKTKQPTGKSLGFKKGDLVFTGCFPGIIISDVNTYAPCCEVFGWEHESGSAYATDLRHLTPEEWLAMCLQTKEEYKPPFRVYSDASFDALTKAGIAVEKAS